MKHLQMSWNVTQYVIFRRNFLCTFVFLIIYFSGFSQNANAIVGTWLNEEKAARIEIYEQKGKYFGKIVWLKEPNENGKPKLDVNNPDPSKRDQPILGLILMQHFTFDGKDTWESGKIYDARNGKTYNCYLTLLDENTLKVRGYIGYAWMGLGRTNKWTRIQ